MIPFTLWYRPCSVVKKLARTVLSGSFGKILY